VLDRPLADHRRPDPSRYAELNADRKLAQKLLVKAANLIAIAAPPA
jgi:hypothetical protein